MGSVGEVIATLDGVLAEVNRAAVLVAHAEACAEEAATTLEDVLAGSANSETERAITNVRVAHRRVLDTYQLIRRIGEEIAAIRDRLTGTRSAHSHDPTSPRQQESGHPISDKQIEQTRTSMRRSPTGGQTTGWWLHPDGSRTRVLSGEDDDPGGWQKRAERFLRERFPDAEPALLALARHTEVKIAIRSRGRPPTHQVVVINRKVCGRDPRTRDYDYTCDAYLPFILEEGTTLTVVEDDGSRVTYVGRHLS